MWLKQQKAFKHQNIVPPPEKQPNLTNLNNQFATDF